MSETAQTDDEFKAGECRWCSTDGWVFSDTGYCENCDSNIFRCCVCNEDQNADDCCRHLFRYEYEWFGSGTGRSDPFIRPNLFRLFNAMPRFFAFDLRKAIAGGRFYTWLSAPLIGGDGSLSLNGWPGRPSMSWVYGDRLMEIGKSERAGEYEFAYHWLASLYQDKTVAANNATVKWINQWIRS